MKTGALRFTETSCCNQTNRQSIFVLTARLMLCANVAVALQRLGLQAGFMGKVGNDPFGEFLRRLQGLELPEQRLPIFN